MKGWLRRSTSNPSGSSGTNRSSPSRWKRSINASAHLWPSKADPTTWQEAFQSHWLQAYSIIQQCNSGTVNGEQVCTIFNHLDQMFLLLLTESNSQEERVIGPILDYFFTEDILSQVFQWILTTPHSVQSTCQLNMLKLYEGLVTQSYQCLLVHKPILYPLLKILDHCSKSPKSSSSTEEVEKHFVLLLNQICTKIVDDSTLLEFFFNKSSAEEGPRFLVFTLMIPYLYVELDVGQLARDAMLLILAVSRKVESVGHFIAEHSNFCPVLATGLSGLFSQLPRRLTSAICASDDWHRITMADVEAIPAMHTFYSSLVFCNAVVQVGHSFVLEQLLDYMYHGFLVSVVGPALYESGLEESVSVTAYLDLCFRTVTEPALMKIFIRFILSEQYEGKKVLETLVDRINNNSRLCLISLALFSTLLELNCEDLLLELLLKYLIPSTHIMVSQTQNLKGSDYYGKTAEKFLSLIPRCCKNSSGFEKNNISTGTRQKRSACSVQSSQQQHQLLNGTSENRDVTTSSHDIETSPPYLEYLLEARDKVQGVYKACSSWSLPYDGENPDPEIFREIGSMISSTATSPISSPPISERSATSSSAFKRQGSLRRSRPNSYFTRRHTSNLLLTETSPNKMTTTDLAVLGPEEFEEVGDPFDLSSPSDSGPPSTFSTPRFEKSGVSMPTDYFKLAFDDDSVPCQTSDSQGEELDTVVVTRGGKRSVSTSFILRGWTEVQDLNTFVEVLNRVRTSQEVANYSLEENLKFLDEKTEPRSPKEQNLTDQDVEGCKQVEESFTLLDSKDSGVGSCGGQEGLQTSEKDEKEFERNEVEREERRDWVAALPVCFRSSFSTPTLGPFLTCLLEKVEGMVHNTMFINLQLTGVISRLACYPQPLITSCLLNPTLVFQPSIRSLFQILGTLRHKIDSYAYSVNNFEALLARGRKHMYSREKKYFSRRERSCSNESDQSSSGDLISIQSHTVKPRSFSEILHLASSERRKIALNSRIRSNTTADLSQRSHRIYHHKAYQSSDSNLEALRTKNMVYCTIVLEEFLKELAAISQEHAVESFLCYNRRN